MALSDEGGTSPVMPVQPMGGYGYGYPMMGNYGGCGNGFGGDFSWIVILFLFAMMGGGFGGGFGGGSRGGFGGGGSRGGGGGRSF